MKTKPLDIKQSHFDNLWNLFRAVVKDKRIVDKIQRNLAEMDERKEPILSKFYWLTTALHNLSFDMLGSDDEELKEQMLRDIANRQSRDRYIRWWR